MSENKDTTYLNQRLADLRITPELNSFMRVRNHQGNSSEPIIEEKAMDIFDADEKGNIIINYFNLNRDAYTWKPENATRKSFIRKRLRIPKEDQKYHQEKGSGQFPFFTPGIIEKYQLAKAKPDADPDAGNIETLVLVEGEFKAFAGYMAGIDVIGIPSIHGFYNGDVRGKLHEDIQEVIITCKVKNVIYLVDADLLTIRWEANKDLAKRIESFYAAIKLFRESLELLIQNPDLSITNVYFMHVASKFAKEDAKGLDDLLCKNPDKGKDIVADLMQFQFANKFFSGYIVNDPNKDLQKIRNYLGLQDEQAFYKTYREFIGSRSFVFRKKHYTYNVEDDKVVFEKHADADKYMRVGSNWIKMIERTNKFDKVTKEMVPWSIAEINRDYKVGKSADFFISQLQKYDDFCNEPNWTNEYQRVHKSCYNLCEPLTWSPKEGSFPTTYKLIKHIFQGQGHIIFNDNGLPISEHCITGDPFTVIMDWLTILLRHPKQMLPVPILVSKENGTGKTTFLKWLNVMFGSNMVILGNEQFKMKFNGHYITKFIIAIDEGFLDVDKKAEKERLKQLVTADSAFLENKGMNVTKINFYGKLIICSNDADRVMKIDEGESRWFVVKVPVIPSRTLTGQEMLELGYNKYRGEDVEPNKKYTIQDVDPDMEKKMETEMPGILNYLFQRNIHHKRVNRLWFDPDWFITDQMKLIVETTKNRVDRVFEDWLKEQFMTYRLKIIRYPLNFLTEVFNDPKNSKYRIDAIELKAYLTERKKLKPEGTSRFKIPVGFDVPEIITDPIKIRYKSELARPYVFKVEEWLNAEEMEEWNKPSELDAELLSNVTGQSDNQSQNINKNSDDLPF
ncbi:MAG: DUF5906 domain-containing protein [Cyclobacteriaceae bacterium]|jgi:hypothetical protein|nr:DUF5906 domain-containing protein [Cytophagales bacterium]MCZ8326454.1 DUF5906 domain-containing protein [Cyclobacteriaceae bacterium]